MGKQKTRQRPDIQTTQENIERHEHILCQSDTCRNVIAAWSLPKGLFRKEKVLCSRCRKEATHEQRDREG